MSAAFIPVMMGAASQVALNSGRVAEAKEQLMTDNFAQMRRTWAHAPNVDPQERERVDILLEDYRKACLGETISKSWQRFKMGRAIRKAFKAHGLPRPTLYI